MIRNCRVWAGVALVVVLVTTPGAVAGEAQGGAEAYYGWMQRALIGIWEDVPEISRSAEAAAGLFVEEDWDLGAWGDLSFVYEFINRAGGVMPIVFPVKPGEGKRPLLVLYAPHEGDLEGDREAIAACREHGDRVIIFARPEVVARAEALGMRFDEIMPNHAAARGGLFEAQGGAWVVPTDPLSNIVVMWTWVGEFVGACTRRGKMPTMWQSVMVPGALARDNKFRKHRFHTYTPTAVPPGWAGRRYLRDLRASLITLRYLEGNRLRLAAEMAWAARQQGHALWAGSNVHCFTQLLGRPGDPGYFRPLNTANWWDMRKLPDFQPGDFALCIAYDGPWEGKAAQNWAERARAAGVQLAWSFTDYKPEAVAGLPPGELFINQRWELGDGLVQFPGYDIKVLPPSGVIEQAILWMIEAEYRELLEGRG